MSPIAPMRRLIRQRGSRRFLKADGDWTGDSSEAQNFHSIPEAIQACQTYELSDVELYLQFGHNELDFTVPLWAVQHRASRHAT